MSDVNALTLPVGLILLFQFVPIPFFFLILSTSLLILVAKQELVNRQMCMKQNKSSVQGRSDTEVWNLFRSGNESAFEFIYQQYFDKLYNYGCQFTQDHPLVEDVLQELFIELKRRCSHLSETDNIQPYLYSAFRRKLIRSRNKLSRFKAQDRQQSFSIVSSVEEAIINKESEAEAKMKLDKGIKGLSERHREIIFLFFYENLSYEEIQQIQGFDNVKSARNLLYKALQSLRKKLSSLSILLLLCPSILKIYSFLKEM
jgi:RNA polymerase sigma-70 factor (ECF subfamily)